MNDNGEYWEELETEDWQSDVYENEYGDRVRIRRRRFDYVVEHKLKNMDYLKLPNGDFMDKSEARRSK